MRITPHARGVFGMIGVVIRDNLEIGRPDQVQLLFERKIPKRAPGRFRTRVIIEGVQPSLRFDYIRNTIRKWARNQTD